MFATEQPDVLCSSISYLHHTLFGARKAVEPCSAGHVQGYHWEVLWRESFPQVWSVTRKLHGSDGACCSLKEVSDLRQKRRSPSAACPQDENTSWSVQFLKCSDAFAVRALTSNYDPVCSVCLAICRMDSRTMFTRRDTHDLTTAPSEEEFDARLLGEVPRPSAALVCHHEARSRVQDRRVNTEALRPVTGVELVRPSALPSSGQVILAGNGSDQRVGNMCILPLRYQR